MAQKNSTRGSLLQSCIFEQGKPNVNRELVRPFEKHTTTLRVVKLEEDTKTGLHPLVSENNSKDNAAMPEAKATL